jgi:hypothetical protein
VPSDLLSLLVITFLAFIKQGWIILKNCTIIIAETTPLAPCRPINEIAEKIQNNPSKLTVMSVPAKPKQTQKKRVPVSVTHM